MVQERVLSVPNLWEVMVKGAELQKWRQKCLWMGQQRGRSSTRTRRPRDASRSWGSSSAGPRWPRGKGPEADPGEQWATTLPATSCGGRGRCGRRFQAGMGTHLGQQCRPRRAQQDFTHLSKRRRVRPACDRAARELGSLRPSLLFNKMRTTVLWLL